MVRVVLLHEIIVSVVPLIVSVVTGCVSVNEYVVPVKVIVVPEKVSVVVIVVVVKYPAAMNGKPITRTIPVIPSAIVVKCRIQ